MTIDELFRLYRELDDFTISYINGTFLITSGGVTFNGSYKTQVEAVVDALFYLKARKIAKDLVTTARVTLRDEDPGFWKEQAIGKIVQA